MNLYLDKHMEIPRFGKLLNVGHQNSTFFLLEKVCQNDKKFFFAKNVDSRNR